MNLTRHTDYGLRVLMLLAARSTDEPRVSTAEVASQFQISLNHLQKVVQSLQQAGYISTTRGRGGGIALAVDPAELTIGAVVRSLEPSMAVVECFGTGQCVLDPGCGLKGALATARDAFLAELDAVTLAQITRRGPLLRLRRAN